MDIMKGVYLARLQLCMIVATSGTGKEQVALGSMALGTEQEGVYLARLQ